MLGNSTLKNAKLKILELTEKYNKPKIISKDISPAHSDSYNVVNVNDREASKLMYNEADDEAHESESVSKNSIKFDVETNQDFVNVNKLMQLKSTSNNLILDIQLDSYKSEINSSLSENEMSDISNQLENINFVSSSSDELQSNSVAHQNHLMSKGVNKLDKVNVVHSVSAEEEISIGEIENISDVSDSNSSHIHNYSQLDQITNTEFDHSISNTEKLNSSSVYNSESIHKKNSDVSVSHQNKLVELSFKNENNVDLQNERLPLNSSPKQQMHPISKYPKVKTTNKGGTRHSDIENVDLVNNHVNDCKHPISDDNEAITNIFCMTSKGRMLDRNNFTNKNHTSKTRRRGDYKACSTKQLSVDHKLILQPSIKQRMLKSCKLLRYTELDTAEFEKLLKQANYLPSEEDIGHISCLHTNKADYYYNGIIKKLLRNQIDLTRHFIESHHQMYLNCCKAIKALNEKTQPISK